MTRHQFAFVLRLWTESPAGGVDLQPQLRGSLQQIDAEEVHYFSSFDSLPELLRQVMNWQEIAAPKPPDEKSTKRRKAK